jgi:dUTP pyrophosphatase
MMTLKFKKLDYTVTSGDGVEEIKKSEGKLPTRAKTGDAGLDLYSTRVTQEVDNSGKVVLTYHTDIAVEIPEGYCGLLMMKSSVWRRSLTLVNGTGMIDAGYRGEIQGKFKVITDAIPTIYQVGEPFAQLVIVPCYIATPEFVEELSETDRGEKGFGEATEEMLNNKNAE